MQIVYAQEDAPSSYDQSVFLVGPTPRDAGTPSWRPAFIDALGAAGYTGVVFVPELRSGQRHQGYEFQVEWEKKHLDMADVIAAWVPRRLPEMPAFTTNVEFGRYVASGRMVYGRPSDAENVRYLDWLFKKHARCREPVDSMELLARDVTEMIETMGGPGWRPRRDGERHVPLNIWNLPSFQSWYTALLAAGNRLDWAEPLWTFPATGHPFAFALKVKLWVESEQRHKANEFILARPDVSCVLAYHKAADVWGTKIVMVREARAPARNVSGKVLELPSGSGMFDLITNAIHELEEETGLRIPADRFVAVQCRQLAATWSVHAAYLYAVELTDAEIAQAEASSGRRYGVSGDSEQTRVEVKTLKELLLYNDADWSMIGMLTKGLMQLV
jgi:ADP-ribose pyrophosphatase YjhB (NUDIX family)